MPDEIEDANVDSIQDSEAADALYAEGMAHYRRREWEEARACFIRLKSIAPGRRNVDALLNEVDLFLQLQEMQPERRRAVPFTSRAEEAREAKRVSRREAKLPRERRRTTWSIVLVVLASLLILFSVLYVTGWLDPLINSQRQARVQSLVNQGRAALNVGEYDRAVAAFGEALALAPNNEDVQTWYAKAQRFQQMDYLYTQAEADMAAEKWDSALEKLEKVIALDPTFKDARTKVDFIKSQQTLDARFAEARRYFEQGKWKEVIDILEQLRETAPAFKTNDVQQTLFYAYFRHGVELLAGAGESLDLMSQAIQSFDRALLILPNDKTALTERRLADLYRQGYLFFNQKNWPQAVLVLQQIYSTRPSYMDGRVTAMLCTSYLRLGDAYHESGDLEQALLQYRNVLAIDGCDHVEAAVKEREVYLALYPPTPTPTRTRTPTRTPQPTPTFTATPLPPTPPPPRPPPPTETPIIR
nr:tetratricopeptide repeat protein [Chloroflexota bacterium]